MKKTEVGGIKQQNRDDNSGAESENTPTLIKLYILNLEKRVNWDTTVF